MLFTELLSDGQLNTIYLVQLVLMIVVRLDDFELLPLCFIYAVSSSFANPYDYHPISSIGLYPNFVTRQLHVLYEGSFCVASTTYELKQVMNLL